MRTEARFPSVESAAGHYESFYVKASAPEGGRGVWIRHTIHKRPGEEPRASIWFTSFGPEAPVAAKATFDAGALSVPNGGYVRVSDAILEPGRAVGSIRTDELEASWELSFEDRHDPLRHLPREWMYRRRLPRTKMLSPHPGASFSGRIALDGEEIAVREWPGMIGHNWGAEHAERWIWIHGAGFDGRDGAEYIDVAAGRIKLGPLTTPWAANGRIVLDGSEHRLGGLGHVYGTEIHDEATRCEFVIPGRGVNVRGTVQAPPERFVAWVYADPDGPEHHALNCSIADLELKVERPGKRHAHLRLSGGATYEIGMRETDHGIPVQPFPDG